MTIYVNEYTITILISRSLTCKCYSSDDNISMHEIEVLLLTYPKYYRDI